MHTRRRSFLWQVFLFCCVLSVCSAARCALSQTSAWDVVRKVPEGTSIRVHTEEGTATCLFRSADAESLTCRGPRHGLRGGSPWLTFGRADVIWIKRSREAASTWAGVALGVATGVGIGAAVDAAKPGDDPHLAAAVFGLVGGIVSFPIGRGTDFLAGPVIYRSK